MDAGLSGEVGWWLHNVQDWPCHCRGSHACDRCWIADSLAATAAHLTRRSWAAAHRAASRAAGIDSRLEELRDRLEPLVSMERGMAMAEDYRWQPCGLTRAEHVEACRDAMVRNGGEYVIAEHHDDETATHYEMATHLACVGTFVLRLLPGHVTDEDMAVAS